MRSTPDDRGRAAAFEPARPGDQRRLADAEGSAEPLQAAHEVEILHNRNRSDPADRLITAAPNENPGITVVEPEPPDPGVAARQPAAEAPVAVEDQMEIAADDPWIGRQRLLDRAQAAGREGA